MMMKGSPGRRFLTPLGALRVLTAPKYSYTSGRFRSCRGCESDRDRPCVQLSLNSHEVPDALATIYRSPTDKLSHETSVDTNPYRPRHRRVNLHCLLWPCAHTSGGGYGSAGHRTP